MGAPAAKASIILLGVDMRCDRHPDSMRHNATSAPRVIAKT